MNAEYHFKNKKITVMGLGLLGRGVGDTRFLASSDAELIVTDLKTEEQLKTSLEELRNFSNITYRLGKHELEDFRQRDFILKSAGIPRRSPYIDEARRNGIPVKMSASWFAEIARIPIIGITGTRGKSTTTHMLHDILRAGNQHVLLGGNVRGVSTLELLPQVNEQSVGLFELDSWQCQGFGETGMSPHIAVFTSFLPDHLNYYDGNMDTYLEDKAQVFLHQTTSDTLVVSPQVATVLDRHYAGRIQSQVVVADALKLLDSLTLQIPGEHNEQNAACAVFAAQALGISDDVIFSAIREFKGVAGRLELVKEERGIQIYNDTTATTPDATLAGLKAVGGQNNVILIMGGSDKGLDMQPVLDALPQYVKKVLLLSGTGTETITSKLSDAVVYESLGQAVREAWSIAQSGDVILFSPAFASFGMFQNEFDRSDQFMALVGSLSS